MGQEVTYTCDVCGTEITEENGGMVEVEVTRYPRPGYITGDYSRRTWLLCRQHGDWAQDALVPEDESR